MRTILATLALLGCSEASPGKPCERGATLTLQVVDNDSPYMKKLFAHVGSDRKGMPSEPAAIAAGIRAEVDQWSTDLTTPDGLPVDSRRHTDYYLRADDRHALVTYLAAYADKPPADREVLLEHEPALPDDGRTPDPAHWRTYYLMKDPILDTRAIVGVSMATNPYNDLPMLWITLTPDGRQAFARATKQRVSQKVATVIDDVVLSAPIINAEIPGGRFTVSTPDKATADALFAKLGCVNATAR